MAVRDGDEWIVNGQKVWTSGAHYSDWAILFDAYRHVAPKHRGITYFLVDMRTPGIDVRPLRQITGAAHFNEVFLSDVRIPHENIVGEINAGWGPMMTTLSNERTLIGGGQGRTGIEDLIALARDTGTDDDAVIRQELAKAYTRMRDPDLPRLPCAHCGVAGRATGARELGDEARGVAASPRDRQSGHGDATGRRHVVERERDRRRSLADGVPRPVRRAHRWRHRSDPTQHHRRERFCGCLPSRGSTKAYHFATSRAESRSGEEGGIACAT